ncbi:Uncharacterised protein [uncultured archaeon]|nr:Uncharacterised protein [uncultured archaeon]
MRKKTTYFGEGLSLYLFSAIVITILIVIYVVLPKFTHSMDTLVGRLPMSIP